MTILAYCLPFQKPKLYSNPATDFAPSRFNEAKLQERAKRFNFGGGDNPTVMTASPAIDELSEEKSKLVYTR